jgi:hypothetical protein
VAVATVEIMAAAVAVMVAVMVEAVAMEVAESTRITTAVVAVAGRSAPVRRRLSELGGLDPQSQHLPVFPRGHAYTYIYYII